jgi:peptide/nickel transport system substrate-binding protein
MSNQNNEAGASQPQITRRNALKLGLGTSVALGLFGLNARIVMAQEGQVLKVAHPAFNQDWSPLRGGGPPYRWNSAWWASPMYFDSKGDLHPYVFTSWEPAADNKTWTFKIDPKGRVLGRQQDHSRGRQGLLERLGHAEHQEPAR